MAVRDLTKLSVFKLALGEMIDQDDYLTDPYDESDVETMIRDGLYAAAIHAGESMKFLDGHDGVNGISLVAETGTLPADYLFHDPETCKILSCVNDGVVERIYHSDDIKKHHRETFSNVDTRNFYRIIQDTIKVKNGTNGATIDEIFFPYIKKPTMLTEVSITDEFRVDVYTHLLHYVIGKLYAYDIATKEQKQMSFNHFLQFYKGIMANDPDNLARAELDQK